jgi:hypothetical protein
MWIGHSVFKPMFIRGKANTKNSIFQIWSYALILKIESEGEDGW